MGTLRQDLRHGIRALLKRPGFTLIAAFMLALGIGTNTAIFSVVNGVLLRALPYGEDERIVTLWQSDLKNGVEREETSPASFLDWRDQNQCFEAVSMAEPFGHSLIDYGEPESFRSWIVSSGFFEVLGANALHGRTFLPEEYQQSSSHVVVMGYGLWQRRFGGDSNIVGQSMVLNGQPHTIIGIMPPEFQFPPGRELWAPRPQRERDPLIRGATYIKVVGRLKPGHSIEQAQQEMNAIAARQSEQYPQTHTDIGAVALPLREYLFGPVRPALIMLFAAVSLVLLIACANVASLLLARATERQREFAIRSAMGASRFRLLRQLLTESLLLAIIGGLGGVLLAIWLIDLIVALGPGQLPRLNQINLNAGVLLFASVISVLTALLFGLAPAIEVSRPDLQEVLKEGGRAATAGHGRQRFRNALIVAEVALSSVLLVGAGLLVRSFVALVEVDPGFAAEKALALEVQLARRTPEQRMAFFDQTLEKISTLPDVQAAGATSALPFHDNQIITSISFGIEGRPPSSAGDEQTAYLIATTPDYFRAIGVPLVRGRAFNQFDRADSAQVVLINDRMARRHWPTEDAVGKKISFANSLYAASTPPRITAEIIGVVGDALPTGFDSLPRPEIYLPYTQAPSGGMTFLVRTATDPNNLLSAVKEKIREVNRNQTFSSTYSLEQLVDKSIAERRFNLLLLASFALISLVLAGMGIYSLISFTTAQRTHEIGVRIALGAERGDVLKLIMGRGLKLTSIGLAVGLLSSLALTRLMSGLLFGVSVVDPVTFAITPALLAAVALAACYIPARRAMKVDPVVALRYE